MSFYKKINPFSKQNNDTGFAGNTSDTGGRFINKDGSFNLVSEGSFSNPTAYTCQPNHKRQQPFPILQFRSAKRNL